jgi:hypothetical protein
MHFEPGADECMPDNSWTVVVELSYSCLSNNSAFSSREVIDRPRSLGENSLKGVPGRDPPI